MSAPSLRMIALNHSATGGLPHAPGSALRGMFYWSFSHPSIIS